MNKHNFVREEFKTAYKSLNNNHHIIYCTGCGYVSYDSDFSDNDKKQSNIPPECGSSENLPTKEKK